MYILCITYIYIYIYLLFIVQLSAWYPDACPMHTATHNPDALITFV